MAVNFIQKGDNRVQMIREPGSLEIGRYGGPRAATVADPIYKPTMQIEVPLAAVDTAGGVFAWANPFGATIIVDEVILYVTTQSSGACTVDVGIAANGTTSNDTFIDGVSVAAAGIFNNIEDKGTNGKSRQAVLSGKYITASMASGATSGLVGKAYIRYFMA